MVRLQVRRVRLDTSDRVGERSALGPGVCLDVEDCLSGLLHRVDERNDAGLLECRLGCDHRFDGGTHAIGEGSEHARADGPIGRRLPGQDHRTEAGVLRRTGVGESGRLTGVGGFGHGVVLRWGRSFARGGAPDEKLRNGGRTTSVQFGEMVRCGECFRRSHCGLISDDAKKRGRVFDGRLGPLAAPGVNRCVRRDLDHRVGHDEHRLPRAERHIAAVAGADDRAADGHGLRDRESEPLTPVEREIRIGAGEQPQLHVVVELTLDEHHVGAVADGVKKAVVVDRVPFGSDGLDDEERKSSIIEKDAFIGKRGPVRIDGAPWVLPIGDGVVVEAERHDEAVVRNHMCTCKSFA